MTVKKQCLFTCNIYAAEIISDAKKETTNRDKSVGGFFMSVATAL